MKSDWPVTDYVYSASFYLMLILLLCLRSARITGVRHLVQLSAAFQAAFLIHTGLELSPVYAPKCWDYRCVPYAWLELLEPYSGLTTKLHSQAS